MSSTSLRHLSNPLVTSTQLLRFKNQLTDEVQSTQFAQAILTQSAGVLLRLPQSVVANALVLLQRFWVLNTSHPNLDANITSAATVYTAAKISSTPLSPRSVINVYAYLTSRSVSPLYFANLEHDDSTKPDPKEYYVSEGSYERQKLQLFSAETQILCTLGFDTHVALPHQLSLTYLQALGASIPKLAQRVFEHLNGALVSPQLLCLTHQPNALAVAAIYLAARETNIKLVEQNWWEVFDVDREDLGFLVLAFGSLANFAAAEKEKCSGKTTPLTLL